MEFFDDANMPVHIVENGKRKTIPARRAINRQLIKKAVEGDMRAMIEWKKEEHKHTREFFDEQVGLLEQLINAEMRYREKPEDVAEEALQIMRRVRELLAPEFQPPKKDEELY